MTDPFQACDQTEESNADNTGCYESKTIYIRPNSPIFIVGLVCIVTGLALVFIVG